MVGYWPVPTDPVPDQPGHRHQFGGQGAQLCPLNNCRITYTANQTIDARHDQQAFEE